MSSQRKSSTASSSSSSSSSSSNSNSNNNNNNNNSLPFPSPALPSPHPTITTSPKMASARLHRRSEPPPIPAAHLSMATGEENRRQLRSARATLVVGGSISRQNRTCWSIQRKQGSMRQLKLIKGRRGRRRTSMMLVHCFPSDGGWLPHFTPSCLPPSCKISSKCNSSSSPFGS